MSRMLRNDRFSYLLLVFVIALVGGSFAAAQTGELTVGIAQDQYRLEGDRANLGVYPFNANITETLVVLTPEFEVAPGLAERWENVEGSTWRFHLRQGVLFHDGTELTAEAVKWSLDRAARAGGSIPLDEDSTQIVDEYTVDITPTLPFFNRVIDNLVHPLYGIYAPGGDPGVSPIGTGPFKLESYQRNEELVVVHNEDYWGEPPQLDRITFRFIPEGSTRALALQGGDVDLITTVPKEMIGFMATLPGLVVHESAPASYVALYLVTQTEGNNDILQDVNLRKAINMAVNREEIVEVVWGGYALPARTLIPPGVFGTIDERVQGYSFDLEAAHALIAEAGWTRNEGNNTWSKDSRDLRVRLVAGFPPARLIAPLPEVLKGQLEDVGIQVELLEYNDIGAFYDEMAAGTSEIFIEQGSYNTADPSFIPYNLFWSPNTWGEAGEFYHWFFVNEDYDQAVERAISTSDQEEAVEAMVRAMQIQVDDYAGVVPIAYVPQIHIARDHVQGVNPHPSGVNQRWTDLSVEGR
jgi:peptide/nickel transport system substrate-binding protein